MMYKKYIVIIALFIFIFFFFSGFKDIENIDDLAYVIAIGLDVGDNETLKLSLQIPATSGSGDSGGGGSGGGSSSQGSSNIIESVECPSIDAGLTLINSYLSKELNLAHCRVIILSEELAETGISKYIYTFFNKIDIRPDANIIISRCPAKTFLDNSDPILEKLSSRYYEVAPTSSKYTGYTDDITMSDFFSSLNDTFSEPCAILGGLNSADLEPLYTKTVSKDSNLGNDNISQITETPVETSIHIENMGLAVFRGDCLVGELSGLETVYHMLLKNDINNCVISVPSPFHDNDMIDLDTKLRKNSKISVDIVNGSPYVHCNVFLAARVLTMQGNSEYLEKENLKKIEEYAKSYIEQQMRNYLYKTSKVFKSDILGIGKYAVSNFLTWEEWTSYNWLSNYENSFFDVNVSIDVPSGFLLVES